MRPHGKPTQKSGLVTHVARKKKSKRIKYMSTLLLNRKGHANCDFESWEATRHIQNMEVGTLPPVQNGIGEPQMNMNQKAAGFLERTKTQDGNGLLFGFPLLVTKRGSTILRHSQMGAGVFVGFPLSGPPQDSRAKRG